MKVRRPFLLTLFTCLAATTFLLVIVAAAGSTVVVSPANTQGWSQADTRPGGAVNFVGDPTAPGGGNGALQLTTNALTTAKAQYMHEANVPLADITELSYWTKQVSASFVDGDASYQLPVCLGGLEAPSVLNPTGCLGFTTLVFEPYQNSAAGANAPQPVVANIWQEWDVASGQFWSSRTATGGGSCNVTEGGGGAPFYTLAGLQAVCPNAVVTGFGVNIGSNNPSYNVYADLVNFNGTTYDFELYEVASAKEQCKNGGYTTVKRADGSSFKNQGDCVSYVSNGK